MIANNSEDKLVNLNNLNIKIKIVINTKIETNYKKIKLFIPKVLYKIV